MSEWISVLSDLSEKSTPCVLLTIMSAKGSVPREAGTKMVVTKDNQFGTIGGGALEFEAIAHAHQMLLSGGVAPETKEYPLGPALAQCCGGHVSVFFEPLLRNRKTLFLFGAGHVGREVVKVMDGLDVSVRWIDPRGDEFPAVMPKNAEKIVTVSPIAELRDMRDGDFVVVMTHSHDLDFDIIDAAFKKGGFAYLGLIGSDTKRARFEKRLLAAGIASHDLKRLVCPIGIGKTDGKHPREIAVSVVAEVLGLGLTQMERAA